MLSKAQIIFIKRAQREAGLGDEDYRDAIAAVSGMADCRSSKDGRLTDEHWDNLLKYFEAIYWRGRGARGGARSRIFSAPDYWKNRNGKGNTSRDRFSEEGLTREILALEGRLHGLGFGLAYLQAIQNRIKPFSLVAYRAALDRTVRAKSRGKGKELEPF